MENNCVKSRIINSLPFIPCSAKIPVIFFLLSVLKIKFAFLIIFAYYILSIGFALVLSFLVCKIKKIKAPLLIIEFPPYRFPSMRNILSKFYKFIKSFLLRIGSVVVVISGFLWLFLSVTPQFKVVEPGNINSFMGIFANKILFLFKPAGITDWRLLVGLIAGLFAKEGAISAFSIMNAENLTSQSIWCFIIFFCFYPPCLTTMLSILVKSGRKRALKVFMFYMIYAYLSSVVLNKLMINFIWGIIYLVILIAFVFIYIMLKSRYISKKAIKT